MFGGMLMGCCAPVNNAPTDYIAFYKLEDDSNDETGDYDGTDTAVTYDTIGALGSVDDDSRINVTAFTLSDASYSMWVKYDDTDSWYIGWNGSSGGDGREFRIKDDGTMSLRCGSSNYTAESSVSDGEYHHIGLARSGDDVSYFVDGELFETNTCGTEDIDFDYLVRKGGFCGEIGDVRIYDRTLSDDEISDIYNEEKGKYE